MNQKSYSLFELNEYLKRVVALNFQNAMWVRCEIAQVNESRGHLYLELVEKEDQVTAKASALLWERTYRKLQRKVGRSIHQILQEGMEVMIQLKVSYHEVYGLRYFVEDIDENYTLGRLVTQKRQLIETLRKEGLLGKNTHVSMPLVVQHVAVISSKIAAGYQDFVKQLNSNHYGYHIDYQLFTAAMQGQNVEEEILFQLKRIRLSQQNFDTVVIIRGGGARLDLMAFDNEKISRAVADFPLPVLTGIGHDIDESVIDLVAHAALKTPTAVADFILNHNLFFENELLRNANDILFLAQEILQEQIFLVKNIASNLALESKNILKNGTHQVSLLDEKVQERSMDFFQKEKKKLEHQEEIFELLKPETALKRGFSLTLVDGKIIKSSKEVKKGVEIETQLHKGIIKSTSK